MMFHANDGESIKNIGGKSGMAMWAEINDLVNRWAKKNPKAANFNRLHNQAVRDDTPDKKYAEWRTDEGKQTGTRLALSIHPELINYIEAFYPKFFESKENIRRFGRTYRMFQIPEVQ